MILYNPIDGDAHTSKVNYRPRTCFLMTQLGGDVPEEATKARNDLQRVLKEHEIDLIDASSEVTGKDFLLKIWKMIAEVPLGVVIIHKDMPTRTQCNIFYEVGMAQSLGKETLIIKTREAQVPSDFVRTEYIEYNGQFKRNLQKYLDSLFKQAGHYEVMADQLENNPLLAIDYLRRAFLISGETSLQEKTQEIFRSAELEGRARNSVEMLLSSF